MKKSLVCFSIITMLLCFLAINAYAEDVKQKFDYFKPKDIVYYQSQPVKKATHTTKYRVIGYTVSLRGWKNSAQIKTVPFADQYAGKDSAGNDLVTTYFEIPAHRDKTYGGVSYKAIVIAMEKANPDRNSDFIELCAEDQVYELNAIMTIIEGENQVPRATMNQDGTFVKSNGKAAQEGVDYFTAFIDIAGARSWAKPDDLKVFYGVPCFIPGAPPDELTPPTAHISKSGSIVTGTLSYIDNETVKISGEKSVFPSYADGKIYKWEFKSVSSSSWNGAGEGEGRVVPTFGNGNLLGKGTYDIRLTVWYRIGSITYPDEKNSTQIVLDIKQSPIGAYVTAEPSTDGNIVLTQAQIDANAAINIKVDALGELKNFTDVSAISQWKLHERLDPAGAGDQYQAFTFVSGLGLKQSASKVFTASAGLLKNADSSTLTFAVKAEVTVYGKAIASTTEYCSVVLTKKPIAIVTPPAVSSNKPPVAVISAPAAAKASDDVFISGYGSYDPDGTIDLYKWYTEGARGGLSDPAGMVNYPEEGVYNITLVVRDNGGAENATQQAIRIVPPTPDANFTVTGKLKEKRIIYLKNTSTSPKGYPIDGGKTTWSIVPIAGTGASNAIVKITHVSTNKNEVTADLYSAGMFTGAASPIIGISTAGQYNITISVTNTAGYTAIKTQCITVEDDLPPVVKVKSEAKVYRETIVNEVNYAKITVNDESFSPDGDYIGYRKIYLVYDANNNGSFGDAADQTILLDESSDKDYIAANKSFEYLTKEVGKYRAFVDIEEFYLP